MKNQLVRNIVALVLFIVGIIFVIIWSKEDAEKLKEKEKQEQLAPESDTTQTPG